MQDLIVYGEKDFEIEENPQDKFCSAGKIFRGRHSELGFGVECLRVSKSEIKGEEEVMRFEEFKNLVLMLTHYKPEKPIQFLVEIFASWEDSDFFWIVHEEITEFSLE